MAPHISALARTAATSRKLWLVALLLAWGLTTCAALYGVKALGESLQGVTRAGPQGFGGQEDALDAVTRCCRFDLLAWEGQELGLLSLRLLDSSSDERVSAEARTAAQRFFRLAGAMQRAEYAVADSTASSATAEQLARGRAELETLRPTAQATLAALVSQQFEAEGLATWFPLKGSQPFPPVALSLVKPPSVLVVSPRDRIFLERSILLEPGITDQQALEMEGNAEALGWSALVEPTGGYSTYPTIVSDRSTLDFALQTVAHEWAHTYLFFHPLGFNYFRDPEMRVINETVADLVGREISKGVLRRHFHRDELPAAPPSSSDEQPFDFRKEMRETRLEAERLVGLGLIEEAEGYMGERRLFFVEHGYRIRKLNQAYFAFHGTYADSPASVSPIGPQLEALLQRSGSLERFLRTVATMSSSNDFKRLLAEQGLLNP